MCTFYQLQLSNTPQRSTLVDTEKWTFHNDGIKLYAVDVLDKCINSQLYGYQSFVNSRINLKLPKGTPLTI